MNKEEIMVEFINPDFFRRFLSACGVREEILNECKQELERDHLFLREKLRTNPGSWLLSDDGIYTVVTLQEVIKYDRRIPTFSDHFEKIKEHITFLDGSDVKISFFPRDILSTGKDLSENGRIEINVEIVECLTLESANKYGRNNRLNAGIPVPNNRRRDIILSIFRPRQDVIELSEFLGVKVLFYENI